MATDFERLGAARVSGTLILVLIVVVWLFVLAPVALRGRKPIRHTNEAFEETRVIHEGGSTVAATRRRPRVDASDIHVSRNQDDLEVIEAEDILIDDPTHEDEPSKGTATRIGETLGNAFSRFARTEKPIEVVEGSVVAEIEPAKSEKSEKSEVAEGQAEPARLAYDDEYSDTFDNYEYDDSYTNPADFLHNDADYGELHADADAEADVEFVAEDENYEAESDIDDTQSELTEEDIEFAARRKGRGGYDPEADAAATSNRFQRRQRTLMALGALVVASVVVAVIAGSWVWILPAALAALTVGYLFVLRQQVRAENELRARRIRHMRRARLGVRSAEGEELGLPPRLRRPGATVLELDDASPDFAYLPTTRADFTEPELEPEVARFPRPRRVS